jgi:SAM-dependent methyltransferase
VTAAGTCRSCGRPGPDVVFDLGRTPLANALLTAEELSGPEPTFPLAVAFCPDCSLVQLTESVPPEMLFREYVYFSSNSDEMLRHCRDLASELVRDRRLTPRNLVVEAASNDGYLLQYYRQAGIRVLGIEPARNIAAVARDRGVETACDFFTRDLAERLRSEGRRADVFHAHNVLAHVPDLNGFVAGIATILADTGVAVIEVPYVREMIDRCEFDTIYHEHLCYFSLTALDALFRRHSLAIRDVRLLPIHGGSLRLYAVPAASPEARPTEAVRAMLTAEAQAGVVRPDYYADFAARVERLRADLIALLRRLKADGKRLAAYGASAKGSTLLNYFGIGGETLEFVADRSTVKQGRFTPGTRLPIVPPSALLERRPDYTLLLTWNFAEEILAQQASYRAAGGRFIIPLPTPTIV